MWLLLLAALGVAVVVSQQGTSSSGGSGGGGGGGDGGGGGTTPPVPAPPGWPTWAPTPTECQAALTALPPELQNAAKAAIENALKVKDTVGLINLAKVLEAGGYKQAGLCIRALIEFSDKTKSTETTPGGVPVSSILKECDEQVANSVKLLPEPLKTQVWNTYTSGTAPKDAVSKLITTLKSSGHPAMQVVAECLKTKYGVAGS